MRYILRDLFKEIVYMVIMDEILRKNVRKGGMELSDMNSSCCSIYEWKSFFHRNISAHSTY